MSDLQKMIDTFNKMNQDTRSKYQLTLGGLIEKLTGFDDGLSVLFPDGSYPGRPHSYRGYYSDLSLSPIDDAVTVGELLAECSKSIGGVFTGYKGGDFEMGTSTPLWSASYGCCGLAIMDAVLTGDKVLLITKDVD